MSRLVELYDNNIHLHWADNHGLVNGSNSRCHSVSA